MSIVTIEVSKEKKVFLPEEIQKKCGFFPSQQVEIIEGKGTFVIKPKLSKDKQIKPVRLRECFNLPPGSLSYLASGPNEAGDFNEDDID
ncbi:MAG: hypothetical protein AB1414_14095 [bacterium]